MGREWYLNWGTKSSSSKKGRTSGGVSGGGSGGGSQGGGERKSTSPPVAKAAAAAASAGGCMNAVLHLFDFQHFQLCLHPQDTSFLPDDPTPLKGLKAPRNSLESVTEEEKDDHLHVYKDIRVKTDRRDTRLKLVEAPRCKTEDLSSECSCSPGGARTPNLVARLMGLDILPESNTTTPRSSHSQISPHLKTSTPPTSSSTTTKPKKTINTKPTYYDNGPSPSPGPRSTRRRSTEVVDHHRLSLQINKENSILKEMELSRLSCSAISTKRKEGKNNYHHEEEFSKSPSYYAKQIMKQVRETVSRRVGVDITNTINGGSHGRSEYRRDEHLLSSSTTKSSKPRKTKKDSSHLLSPSSSLSLSPKRFNKSCDEKNKEVPVVAVKEAPQKMVISEEDQNLSVKKMTKTLMSNKKPPLMKSFDSIRNNKKDEQFVRPSTSNKKSKNKTMLSSDLIHGTVPSVVSLKKKDPPTKLLDKQGVSSNVQLSKPIMKNTSSVGTMTKTTTTNTTTTSRLSRYPRQRIDNEKVKAQEGEEATHASTDRWRSRKDATANSVMEFQYITRILKCTGIDRDTPVSFMRWFLPSNPLDPSIYHNLEATHYLTTSDKFACDRLNLAVNRKLIFHLVDEMLAEILKPYVNHHYHHLNHVDYKQHNQQINGFQLVKILCTKIRSFPSADCQTLQDIDALVEKDLPKFGASSSGTNLIDYQDEGEEIVSAIESEIMESLVQEICCLD